MTDYKCLLYEVKDAVATLTLNRPERLNALGDTLRDDLYAAVLRASGDADVRVMIVTGAGKGFCAGGDVKAMNDTKEGRAPARPLEDKVAPLRDQVLLDLRGALEFETFAQNVCSETEDAREGIKAFVEKRAPQFKGR